MWGHMDTWRNPGDLEAETGGMGPQPRGSWSPQRLGRQEGPSLRASPRGPALDIWFPEHECLHFFFLHFSLW